MFGLGRRELIIFAVVILAVVFGTGYRLSNMKSVLDEDMSFVVNEKDEKTGENTAGVKNGDKNSAGEKDANIETEQIVVHVSGAVKKSGVYNLPAGSRVIDALNLAVPTAQADLEQLNLAAEISDGEQIAIPRKGEPVEDRAGSHGFSTGSGKKRSAGTGGKTRAGGAAVKISAGKVNINKADITELDTLPGIGPALAERIVEYREGQGDFKDISELRNVSGIGDKKYEGLAELVTVK